jgi:hypothetical protein
MPSQIRAHRRTQRATQAKKFAASPVFSRLSVVTAPLRVLISPALTASLSQRRHAVRLAEAVP